MSPLYRSRTGSRPRNSKPLLETHPSVQVQGRESSPFPLEMVQAVHKACNRALPTSLGEALNLTAEITHIHRAQCRAQGCSSTDYLLVRTLPNFSIYHRYYLSLPAKSHTPPPNQPFPSVPTTPQAHMQPHTFQHSHLKTPCPFYGEPVGQSSQHADPSQNPVRSVSLVREFHRINQGFSKNAKPLSETLSHNLSSLEASTTGLSLASFSLSHALWSKLQSCASA